ncbi:aminoglycoside phosphotransferase family protein [Maridesulfovibrio sp.]|uniref:phosphotransferase family protein n=1 Tax=Maridesulfovibrio sp. TaxID=2795000 RepID=UPI002A18CA81|nr:aminoglycoside phosphotransferase family protein [Maridesulfovibrio sp.]
MIEITADMLESYLKEAFGDGTELVDYGDLGYLDKQGMKKFGYGKPLLVRFVAGGEERETVISVMKGDNYGHQFYWDRAAILMFQYETSASLSRHVKPMGIGYVGADGSMRPVIGPREFFILNEKLEGYDYFHDLDRIRKGGYEDRDREMAGNLAGWLAEIHGTRKDDSHLYMRRIRDLIGSSECIMGLVDEAYAHPSEYFSRDRFIRLEKRLIDWRWKLAHYTGRLCAVHGDFHPWNVLVGGPEGFSVLDRSRGEWGEAAGDLCCMAANYILFGLYDDGGVSEHFRTLYMTLFEKYLELTGDSEILEVMGPFFVFRGLVIASPVWYPDHPVKVRESLLRFIENVLEDEVFDYARFERYMR